MTTILKELELDEVSLVDVPANQQAIVAMFKRDNTMTDQVEDVTKALKEDVAKARSELERLTKALIDNGFTITAEAVTKKAVEETIEVEGESIVKSAVPEVIWKTLKAQTEAIEKAAIEKRVADELPNFRGTADEKAALLKAVDASPMATELLTLLKSADAVFKGLTLEVGHGAADTDMKGPVEKLDELTKAYAETNKVNYVVASATIQKTAEGRELLKQITALKD